MGRFKPETSEGPMKRIVYREKTPDTVLSEKKGKIRDRIEKEVGDVHSLLADAHDMISLLMSTTGVLYSLAKEGRTDAEVDAIIGVDKRVFLEHAINKFSVTTTTADLEFAVNPTGKVDELIDTQGQVGTIVKEEKGL